jgi:hypothetical protein
MATDKLIVDVVTKNTQRLDALEKQLGRVNRSTIDLGGAAKLAAGAFAALGTGKLLKGFVDVGRSVQNLQLRFKFLFGSAEEGAAAFDTLTEFAGKVPFSLEQIAAASGNLAVVSDGAKGLGENLELAGNIAAVTGLDFQTVGEQLQRALSGGISAADLLRERGVTSLLGFKAGATVTVAETAEALNREFGPGGRFGNAAATLANTFDGVVSMLGDKFFNFQKTVGEEFIAALQDEFGALDEALKENADTIDEIARALGGALATAVSTTGKTIRVLADNIELVKAAFVGLALGKTIILFSQLIIKIREASTAMALLNTVVGKNPFVKLASVIFAAGGAIAYYMHRTSDATQEQEEFNDILKDTLRLSEEMSEGSLINITPTNSEKESKAQTDAIAEMLEKEKSFLDAMGILGETAIEKSLREEQEKIERLERIRSQDVEQYQKYTDMINKVEEQATNERMQIYAREQQKLDQERRKNVDLFKSGQYAKADITKATEEDMKEIAVSTGRDTLDLLASQNKKFFELQKAVKIAEAIQNTYLGATKAFAQGGVLGFVTGALVIASGMAQVAAIRSQQYPGRQRGGQVMSGKSYLVGEAGPELITPGANATVTPNDQLGMGSITINFNVTATDATSFDNLLQQRRDTIVGVINQALNERGKRSITA